MREGEHTTLKSRVVVPTWNFVLVRIWIEASEKNEVEDFVLHDLAYLLASTAVRPTDPIPRSAASFFPLL